MFLQCQRARETRACGCLTRWRPGPRQAFKLTIQILERDDGANGVGIATKRIYDEVSMLLAVAPLLHRMSRAEWGEPLEPAIWKLLASHGWHHRWGVALIKSLYFQPHALDTGAPNVHGVDYFTDT